MTTAQALDTLNLNDPYQAAHLKKAYRTKAAQHHPDAGGDIEAFKLTVEAYETLIGKRQAEDKQARTTAWPEHHIPGNWRNNPNVALRQQKIRVAEAEGLPWWFFLTHSEAIAESFTPPQVIPGYEGGYHIIGMSNDLMTELMVFFQLLPEGGRSYSGGDLRNHPDIDTMSRWVKVVLDLIEPHKALQEATLRLEASAQILN